MLLTRASEYALLSLLLLAKSDKPLDTETLSSELKISKSFLAKILQALARRKILNSYKGVNGGFSLARKMEEISIFDIMESAEKKAPAVFDCSDSIESCPSQQASTCAIWPMINNLQGRIDIFLKNISLKDILEQES
ncbi:MAG: Rrf2 family transcriptional regulator [Helicobacteraceae bacterium]|nr:Rrf2 family transcriptional regulator [Helicobacteraceae bacterium]